MDQSRLDKQNQAQVKSQYPLSKISINLNIIGAFNLPEEWKTLEEQNPNFFAYSIKFQNQDFKTGKYIPKQLSQSEQRIKLEEEELAKAKKGGKKGGKDGPSEEKEIQDRIKKIKEQDEEDELKNQQEFATLSEEEKQHRILEDKCKNQQITFTDNVVNIEKEGRDLVIFEERVKINLGDWLIFSRFPNVSDDEINKIKKAKGSKTLSLENLNPVEIRAWCNFSSLNEQGMTEIQERAIFQPISQEEQNMNLGEFYVYYKMQINLPLFPVITEPVVTQLDLLPLLDLEKKFSKEQISMNELQKCFQIIMDSLAQEYSNTFGEELNAFHLQKIQKFGDISNSKNQQVKRRDNFYYDMNVYGKYKLMKDKLKKNIVRICQDKFKKEGSLTGITADQKDQFYSELYYFLIKEMRKELKNQIVIKKENLNKYVINSKETNIKERNKLITELTGLTLQQTLIIIANENEILNYITIAEQTFQKLLENDQNDFETWNNYASFLLRNNLKKKAQKSLQQSLQIKSEQYEKTILLACLYITNNNNNDSIILLNDAFKNDLSDVLYNGLLSIIYDIKQNKGLQIKYLSFACRQIMKQKFKEEENQEEQEVQTNLPGPKEPIMIGNEEEENQQKQQVYIKILEFCFQNDLYDLMDYCIKKLIYKNTDTAQLCQAKLLITQNKPQEALDIYQEILETQTTNLAVLQEKANLLYKMNENIEKEFFLVLKLSNKNRFEFYLKLGYFYLNKQDWQKAIAVLVKALAENKQSPMTWLGLGKAYYYNKDYEQSRISLNQANVYDHMNPQIWSFLVLNALKENQNVNLTNQCLRELFKLDCKDVKNELVEIADYLFDLNQIALAEQCFIKAQQLFSKKDQIETLLKINLKLSECQKILKKYQLAIQTLKLTIVRMIDKDVISDLQQQVKSLIQFEQEANA